MTRSLLLTGPARRGIRAAPPDVTAPAVPTGLAAGTPTSSAIAFTWDEHGDADGDLAAIRMYYTLDGSGVTDESDFIDKTADSTGHGFSGLDPETEVSVRLAARDASGNQSALTAEVSETTEAVGGGDEPHTDLLFQSDHSTATGNNTAAVLDTGKDVPWQIRSGGGGEENEVVSSGHGMPSANALLVRGTPAEGLAGLVDDIIRVTGLPVPGVGEDRFYRWYLAVLVDDVHNAGPGGHPIQDGNAAGDINWMYNTQIAQDGTWYPMISTPSPTWNESRWHGPTLDKFVRYRFELHIHRATTTHYEMHWRIYAPPVEGWASGVVGTLIADDSDFHGVDAPSMLLSDEPFIQFPFNDVNNLDGLNAGQNGPNGSWTNLTAGVPIEYYMQACFAVRAAGWCGPYITGESTT